jgi:hypothetical protein
VCPSFKRVAKTSENTTGSGAGANGRKEKVQREELGGDYSDEAVG